MNKLTKSEEDYLKALFHLIEEQQNDEVGTNQVAQHLDVKPASASAMLKKLRKKSLIDFEKYGKIRLLPAGRNLALDMVRKHRLWETFLHKHMQFEWDEVHDVAEQLEHIDSEKLIEELERFLGHPKFDPHGDPIPPSNGKYKALDKPLLADLEVGERCYISAVNDHSSDFLRFVKELGLALSSEIKLEETRDFDGSLLISFDGRKINVSRKFAQNVMVTRIPATK